jgi:hypothetical protein
VVGLLFHQRDDAFAETGDRRLVLSQELRGGNGPSKLMLAAAETWTCWLPAGGAFPLRDSGFCCLGRFPRVRGLT